jgi:hypothetical protein
LRIGDGFDDSLIEIGLEGAADEPLGGISALENGGEIFLCRCDERQQREA